MENLSKDGIEQDLINITKQLLVESGVTNQREIKIDASLQRHLGIDSLGRAELFQRIEKKFNISMPDRLLASAETLADIATHLQSATPGTQFSYTPKILSNPYVEADFDWHKTQTLTDVVLGYAKCAPQKPHIYFQNEAGVEEVITYGQLLESSLKVAHALKARGLKEGETVAIMLPTQPSFFYVFLGTMFAGGIPVPIYPPFRMHMLEAYAKTEAHILQSAGARVLVTFAEAEKLSLLVQNFVPSLKVVVNVDNLTSPDILKNTAHLKEDSFAFIQYSSGSTSHPKGVLLTHHNLLSNIRAFGKAIEVKPTDVAVSWLPLYHDLGLIGMWLGSMCHGVPLVLLAPFTFLNHPERWLWAIHYHHGTISGAPNFAYELCIRKIDPARLEGLDLSSWRLAANGAEKVYPRTLDAFAKKFAPYGFRRNALMPVYGLAESTVGLAAPPPGREFKVDKVDRKAFEENKRAIAISETENSLEFVSCGKPLVGHEIRIVDEEANVLPERSVGRLQFRGPSSMQGYFHNPKATAEIYHDGWLDSGDLAYLAEDEVYITGRRKDLIIKAGRNLYPAEIEELVGNIAGVRQGCVVAFASHNVAQGTEDLVVVAETREKNKAQQEVIERDIKFAVSSILDIVPDHIVLVKPNTVPKTSSGKLQRAATKTLYEKNLLHKKLLPPWVQVAKLAVNSFLKKCWNALRWGARIIYTAYVVAIAVITFIPIYLIIWLGPLTVAEKALQRWAKVVLTLALCPVKINHKEKLYSSSPMIFTANHASYVDAIVALSFVPPNTRLIAKKELFSMPFLGPIMRKMQHISVDRLDMPKSIDDAKQFVNALQNGFNIFVFPEGTFSYASGLRPFRLGAFKIAAEANFAVCPIGIIGARAIWRESERTVQPGKITVTIADPIFPEGNEWRNVTELRDKTRAEIAKYCGEPTLDFIAAKTVAPRQKELS